MEKPTAQFENDIKTNLVPMLMIVSLVGVFIGLVSDIWYPAQWSKMADISILMCGVAVASWFLQVNYPRLSGWVLCVGIAGTVIYGSLRLEMLIFLSLLVAPNILAAALFGFRAALLMTSGETILFIFFYSQNQDASISVALLILWVVLAAIRIMTQAMQQVAQWSWEYYQTGLAIRRDAYEQQGRLNQAMEDLTRANLQLTRLNRLAQSLRQAAEDARLAKEQFVANVSHELRTPLNMIIGFSETMLQSPETYGRRLSPALMADLTVVHRNAQHLSALIDDILDLSQVEMGEMMITREQVHFQEILDDVLVAVSPLYESKHLYLRTQVQEDLPQIFCDRTRIREVVLNLLSNAGRFTEQGGVLLKAWAEEKHLYVSVTDTGPGIKPEDMAKLFQPFSQVDGSIRRRFGGSGLGLSISKRFIELHDGRIWAQSQEGAGATFFFTIPIQPSGPVESGVLSELVPEWEFARHPRPHQSMQGAERPRFVVVETGKTLQRILGRYIEGAEVVPFTDLGTAVEELHREPARALLVNDPLAAQDWPGANVGCDLPEGIPLLAVSLTGFDEEASTLGAARRLVKPVQREVLRDALDGAGVSEGALLVVDDDPDTLQMLGRMLSSYGRDYRVLFARSGREALDMMKETLPDLILLDLVMPGMDGFQFLQERSLSEEFQNIPVIVISARDPSQQPIASNALMVTQKGGLSARQVLKGIEFFSSPLAAAEPAEHPGQPGTEPG